MPKKMSAKQIEANRRNAKKSTGPKTPAGRAVSKLNALKHGILSKEVLVRGLHRKESATEFAALNRRFRDDLQPVGPVEEMLVDQIVTAHWRLRRALTAESGEIALSVDEGAWQRERGPHPLMLWAKWEMLGDPVHEMENSVMGNGLLSRWLYELRRSVEQAGELTEAAIRNLVAHFGGKPNSLTRELDQFRLKLLENPEGLEAAALPARHKEWTLTFLDRRLHHLEWLKDRCRQREDAEEAARQDSAALPSLPTLDKILRYETKLERQLYRALAQLERVQRRRQGEDIPAPLSVEVSERP